MRDAIIQVAYDKRVFDESFSESDVSDLLSAYFAPGIRDLAGGESLLEGILARKEQHVREQQKAFLMKPKKANLDSKRAKQRARRSAKIMM